VKSCGSGAAVLAGSSPADAGGANSAAPTVQSGNKPLKVNPDCPPDSKPK